MITRSFLCKQSVALQTILLTQKGSVPLITFIENNRENIWFSRYFFVIL
jgi:hypothetical protein